MTEPTLKDCINYMKSQLKGMEKYPKSYEFNIPYYRKTVEFLLELAEEYGMCLELRKCKTCCYYSDATVKCCDRNKEPTTPDTPACPFWEEGDSDA